MIRVLGVVGCLSVAAFFAGVFHERYWRVRDCFGDEGRCYDPETEQVLLPIAGPLWGGCTVLWLAAGAAVALTPGGTSRASSRAGPRRRRAR
jgi:hypothetical protein